MYTVCIGSYLVHIGSVGCGVVCIGSAFIQLWFGFWWPQCLYGSVVVQQGVLRVWIACIWFSSGLLVVQLGVACGYLVQLWNSLLWHDLLWFLGLLATPVVQLWFSRAWPGVRGVQLWFRCGAVECSSCDGLSCCGLTLSGVPLVQNVVACVGQVCVASLYLV